MVVCQPILCAGQLFEIFTPSSKPVTVLVAHAGGVKPLLELCVGVAGGVSHGAMY